MKYFVGQDSIVRKIWGKSDIILMIFAGASAEFALNKAVDWLYFTGRLPKDPLGRLFSTVSYARKIVFSSADGAHAAIDAMRNIHTAVEHSRKAVIPNEAYQDVLFMLIHYSIASFELLDRKLSEKEKEEVFDVFRRVGERMQLTDLPLDYGQWLTMREEHLRKHLRRSGYTNDLYRRYKKSLGTIRYTLLLEGQTLIVPHVVSELLDLRSTSLLTPVLFLYKLGRKIKIDWLMLSLILPAQYRSQVKSLNSAPA